MTFTTLRNALRRSEPWLHRGLALAMFMLMGGALSYAAEASGGAVLQRVSLTAPIIPVAQPKLIPVTVWDGADIDGDGEEDFVNPTGGEPRGHDEFGSGEFGASRDGGGRRHEGVDYVATAGQAVAAPISGYITKVGYAYDDDRRLTFVEISNPALKYTARTFYVSPTVQEGQAVQLGETIGEAENLQSRYPGITNHVHLELMRSGRRIDAATVLASRVELKPQAAG